MDRELPSYNGVVYPAMTDAMGHMNVQHFVAAFDQAMWRTVLVPGYETDWQSTRGEGWADVLHETRFAKEAVVGGVFTVSTTVEAVGRTSLTLMHRMRDQHGALLATMKMKSVYFDLKKREAIPLPDALRQNAHARLSPATEPGEPG